MASGTGTVEEYARADGTAQIRTMICDIIAQEFHIPRPLIEETDVLRDLPGMESLRILRSVARVEKHFRVELSDDMVFSIQTVTELASIVHGQLSARHHG